MNPPSSTTGKQRVLIDTLRSRFGAAAVQTDRAAIAPWLSDWRGRYHGWSEAILAPASTDQVAAMVALAAAHQVALVPQGGNTGMVGGATPPADGSALILSLRRMNRIRSLDPDSNLAVAEAGVILQTLHEAARAHRRRFPLTLGARGSCTVGGLVSTNAGGTQVLRFGTMRSLVAGVEAVLPDGSVHDGLAALKKDNRGYDLTQLLVGAEGTLGVVTAASLRLVPDIVGRAVAWVGLASPQAALDLLRSMEATAGAAIEGFEIMPSDTLDRVIEHIPGARSPLAGTHPWHVLIEAASSDPLAEEPAALLERLLGAALERGRIADAAISASEAQAEAMWHLRDSISEAERATGPAVQHDISVPVEAMPRFMVEAAEQVEQRYPGAVASAFGHLGDGNVHFHVRAGRRAAPGWHDGEARDISRMVNDLVTAAGGSISAEHGIGQMKLGELERLSSPARLAALRSIKQAIDPQGIMNPGKLVGTGH